MIGAELALIIALAQQPRTVALVIDGRTAIVELSTAEVSYKALEAKRRHFELTPEERKWHSALTVALGTIRQDTVQCHDGVRENWVGELFTCGN